MLCFATTPLTKKALFTPKLRLANRRVFKNYKQISQDIKACYLVIISMVPQFTIYFFCSIIALAWNIFYDFL